MRPSLLTENNLVSTVVFASQTLVDGEGEIEAKVSFAVDAQGANQVQLLVDFTSGSSSGVILKVEFSEDKSSWYQETIGNFITTQIVEHLTITRKITATSSPRIAFPVSSSWFRVTATALTVGTGASVSITATIANI